jgi:hypothetical protein
MDDDPAMLDGRTEQVPPAVAATMRRVHAELRAGGAPSFEALLAYGEPQVALRAAS